MKNYTVGYSKFPDEDSTLESFLEHKINEEAFKIGNHKITASCEKDAYEMFINSPTYGDVLPRSIWVGKWGFAQEIYFNEHINAAKNLFDEKFPKIAPCADCGREISRSATACPQCGCITPAGHQEKRLQIEAEEIQAKAADQTSGTPLIVQFAALGFIIIFVLPFLGKSCAP